MLHFFFALLLSRQQVWANEVAKFPEKGWLALTDVALVPVNLHIVVTDPREPKMLTVESGVTDPILLVHGVKGLQTGSVTVATIDGPEDPRPGDRLSIDLGGHHYQVTFDADDRSGTHMRVRLSDESQSQLLWSAQEEYAGGHWWVIWAGDLDRDGKLDLLVDFSNQEDAYPDVLLLSSHAKPGQMVGEAAHFYHAAC